MLLYLCLTLPSTYVVQKYLGWTVVAVYLLAAAIGLRWFPAIPDRWSDRRVATLAIVTAVVVLLAFAVVYPLVNVQDAHAGSDDDDAYDVGVSALLDAESPYDRTTYLGNRLHQLPGAFLIAAPLTLLGTSAFQNPFWLTLFFLAVWRESRNARFALRLAWMVLALSPAVMHGVVTGTAHVANTIYVALGLWWLARTARRPLAAIAWGIALASRANFLMLLPLVLGSLKRTLGWRPAAGIIGLTAATAAAVTLPFYLHAPSSFAPLEAADRLTRFDVVVPHAGTSVLVAMLVTSLILGATRMDRAALFRNAAWVQAVPVIGGLILSTMAAGIPDLRYAEYGTFAVWFVCMAEAVEEGALTTATAG